MRDRWALLWVTLAAISALSVLGLTLSNAQKSSESDTRISAISSESHTAKQTAEAVLSHDQRLFFAICRRFSKSEQISAWENAQMDAIEKRFPRPNNSSVDVEYHKERRVVLAEADKEKQALARSDCRALMLKALSEAPVSKE